MSDDTFVCNSCQRRRRNEFKAGVIKRTRFICASCKTDRDAALKAIAARKRAGE